MRRIISRRKLWNSYIIKMPPKSIPSAKIHTWIVLAIKSSPRFTTYSCYSNSNSHPNTSQNFLSTERVFSEGSHSCKDNVMMFQEGNMLRVPAKTTWWCFIHIAIPDFDYQELDKFIVTKNEEAKSGSNRTAGSRDTLGTIGSKIQACLTEIEKKGYSLLRKDNKETTNWRELLIVETPEFYSTQQHSWKWAPTQKETKSGGWGTRETESSKRTIEQQDSIYFHSPRRARKGLKAPRKDQPS